MPMKNMTTKTKIVFTVCAVLLIALITAMICTTVPNL